MVSYSPATVGVIRWNIITGTRPSSFALTDAGSTGGATAVGGALEGVGPVAALATGVGAGDPVACVGEEPVAKADLPEPEEVHPATARAAVTPPASSPRRLSSVLWSMTRNATGQRGTRAALTS